MNEQTQTVVFGFGDYRVCPRRRRLELDGRTIAITAKAFDTLVTLLDRSGEVVTKDELMTAVWPDTVVEENNLIQQISYLRKLLGDGAGQQDLIVTVPGRGYSFVARVGQTDYENSSLSVSKAGIWSSISGWIKSLEHGRLTGYSWAFLFIALVCLPVFGPVVRNVAYPDHPQSLAVLGFRIAAAGDEPIGAGISDTLRARLGSVEDLVVRPGPNDTAFQNVVAAGKELHVNAVLTGSVQRSDDRIRVTVEMIDVENGRIVWGRIFDNSSSNVFELQDSIAGEVADFLKVRFSPPSFDVHGWSHS